MIPKIIHLCWLSDTPLPDAIKRCVDTWHDVLPDYEVRLWNFKRFPKERSAWVAEAFDQRKYAFAADYIRNYALYHDGGIYLDADVEVLKSFDKLLHLPYFMGFENGSGLIDAGVMGSEPHNPIFEVMLRYYDGRHFCNSDGTLNTLPLPKLMKRELEAAGYDIRPVDSEDAFVAADKTVSVLPFDYFSPIHQEHRRLESTDRTMAIHRFAASWVPWHNKIKRIIKHMVGPNATAWFIRTKRRILRKTT